VCLQFCSKGHHRSKSRTRGTQSLDLPTLAKAQLPPPLSELDPEEDQGGPLNRRIPSYPQIDLVAHHAHQPVPAISVHDDDHVPLQVVGETYVYPVLDEDDEKWNVAGFLIKLAVCDLPRIYRHWGHHKPLFLYSAKLLFGVYHHEASSLTTVPLNYLYTRSHFINMELPLIVSSTTWWRPQKLSELQRLTSL
jgi:hypothetical protein